MNYAQLKRRADVLDGKIETAIWGFKHVPPGDGQAMINHRKKLHDLMRERVDVREKMLSLLHGNASG